MPAVSTAVETPAGGAAAPRRLLPLLAFATGFAGLAAEVVWNKYLGIFLGSNIFGLSLVLSLFLLGIATGSLLLAAFIERVRNPSRLLELLLISAAAALFATTRLLNLAPLAANVTGYYFPGLDFLAVKSTIAALVLFPSGAVLGAILPLLIRLRIREGDGTAAVTGRLYAMNTLGSILGSCVSGLVLIPYLCVRMREDYFMPHRDLHDTLAGRHPVIRWAWLIFKHLLGLILIAVVAKLVK